MKKITIYTEVTKKEKKKLQNLKTDLDLSQKDIVAYMVKYALENEKEVKEMIKDDTEN